MMRRILLSLLTGLVFCSGSAIPAYATEDEQTEDEQTASQVETSEAESISSTRRGLAIGASILPGALLHGSGHFVAGDATTGWRLVGMQAGGLALLGGGVAGLALSGAGPTTVVPFIFSTALGTELFAFSWLADIFGVSTNDEEFGYPHREISPLRLRAGYQFVYNPTFPQRHFTHLGLEGRWDHFGWSVENWLSPNLSNWRLRGLGSWRFIGPTSESPVEDGSFLDLQLGLTHHDWDSEGFSTTTGEATMQTRLDLEHLAETLRGSFIETGLGFGTQTYAYDHAGRSTDALLLFNTAFGFYLGGPDDWGEIKVYYDHRHDGYVAGTKLSGVGSGPLGHVGALVRTQLVGDWGLEARAAAGSSYVGSLNVIYHFSR